MQQYQFYLSLNQLSMFRAIFYPSSGAQDCGYSNMVCCPML